MPSSNKSIFAAMPTRGRWDGRPCAARSATLPRWVALRRTALVTIALSPKMELSALEALYAGIRRACAKFDVALVGGETSRSPGPLFINVALTGFVERAHCITRSGGRAGDLLYVTGRLGGSGKGKHLTFTCRVCEKPAGSSRILRWTR
jgi:thiamine-monophosphate kinase